MKCGIRNLSFHGIHLLWNLALTLLRFPFKFRSMAEAPSPRKSDLCRIVRQSGEAFISTTTSPESARESVRLRAELDSLVALWEFGGLDPVASFNSQNLSNSITAHDPAPLH